MRILRFVGSIGVVTLLMIACGQSTESGGDTTPGNTAASSPAPAPTSTTAVSTQPDAAAIDPDHCLDCHTDKQRLIDTARPEEVKPSESSGVG